MNDGLEALATGHDIQDFVVGWQPPAPGEEPGRVTPDLANGFARTSAQNCDGIADFRIDLPGVHSAYEFAPNRVDVYMFPITKKNRNGLIEHVKTLIKSATGILVDGACDAYKCFIHPTRTTQQFYSPTRDDCIRSASSTSE